MVILISLNYELKSSFLMNVSKIKNEVTRNKVMPCHFSFVVLSIMFLIFVVAFKKGKGSWTILIKNIQNEREINKIESKE